jgi:hypothetical protein
MRVFCLTMLALVIAMIRPSAQKLNEAEVCEALLNAYRVQWGAAPAIHHDALDDEAKRHLQEMKRFHYLGDYGIAKDGVSRVTFGERACTSSNPESDPASEPGYPCTTYDEFSSTTAVTGWVAGVSADGFVEARTLCSENGWMNPNDGKSDEITIRNPQWVHIAVAKSGKLWTVFFGWPAH